MKPEKPLQKPSKTKRKSLGKGADEWSLGSPKELGGFSLTSFRSPMTRFPNPSTYRSPAYTAFNCAIADCTKRSPEPFAARDVTTS